VKKNVNAIAKNQNVVKRKRASVARTSAVASDYFKTIALIFILAKKP